MENIKAGAVALWSVHSVIVGTCSCDRLLATSRSVTFSQSQPLLLFGVEMPQGPLLVAQAGLTSGLRFSGFLSSPTAAGFGLLRWSVARCNLHVVQFFQLVRAPCHGHHFCYHPLHLGCLGV